MIRLPEIANSLHFENIFIHNELTTIKQLNAQVKIQAEKLTHNFWITNQKYLHLQKQSDYSQGNLLSWQQHSSVLESLQFVDSCRDFECQVEYIYNSLLQNFIAKPSLVATCLAFGEEHHVELTNEIAHVIIHCCYGNSFLTDDYKQLLEVIETLFILQYVYNPEPKLSCRDDTIFVVVFKLFVEFLLGGKVFLTSALYQPLMEIVKKDHLLLETNQHKLITRLTPEEIEKMFGTPAGPNFEKNIKEHLRQSELTLMEISLSIITGLLSAFSSFPSCLGWILARFYQILKGNSSDARARTICMDLLLSNFICPALTNPEQYGIIEDLVINDTCRSNLTQIAENLRNRGNFERANSVESWENETTISLQLLIDTIVSTYDSPSVPHVHESLVGLSCSAVLIAPYQLQQLIQFLETINGIDEVGIDHGSLDDILSHLPKQLPTCVANAVNWHLATADESSHNKDSPDEIVFAIPLQIPESEADKQIGLLSEAEVLCLEETPKATVRNEKSMTSSHFCNHIFENDLKQNQSHSEKESEAVVADQEEENNASGDVFLASDSDSSDSDSNDSDSNDSDCDDELFDYHVNLEIRPRFASVVRIDQSVINDKLQVCVIEAENHVEETSFVQTKGKHEDLKDIDYATSTSDLSTSSSQDDLLPDISSIKDHCEKSFSNIQAAQYSHSANSSPIKLETALERTANKLTTSVDHYSSSSSLGSGNNHLMDIPEVPNVDQLPSKEKMWKQKEMSEFEKEELRSMETRSRMKAAQLLGITLEGSDSEWDSKLVLKNRSQNKAEQILGISLIDGDVDYVKQQPFRRARSQVFKADLPASPRKKLEGNSWRNFKRRGVSSKTKRSTISSERTSMEMRSGSIFGRRPTFKLRRSSTEVAGAEEVMQKYKDIHALRRLKSVGGNPAAEDLAATSPSDSQSKDATDSDRVSSNISNSLDTDSHTEGQPGSSPALYSSSSTLPYNSIADVASRLDPNCSSMPNSPKNDLSKIKSFVKKKLRIILCKYQPPSQSFPASVNLYSASSPLHNPENVQSNCRLQLLSHLQTLIAQSQIMHNHFDHVMLVEVMRCVQIMDENFCSSVIENLWEDYQKRVQYIAYLVRSRQQLLALLSYLRSSVDGLQRENNILRRYSILQSVRSFLKRKESDFIKFRVEFSLVASDEKVSLINEFLSSLYGQLVESSTWADADSSDLAEAEIVIERYVFDHVYSSAMFPNGDADLQRDTMFQNLISRLSVTVTPQHPSLQIPDKYLISYPWSEAQSQANALTIYRSPKDKLQAAVRCCQTVLHLLQLADEYAPASDDMIPVLLFVLIKANPPHLLSTKQYIDDFLGENMHGRDAFLWTMFKSALVYIQSFSTS